jgi:hypothetical protein
MNMRQTILAKDMPAIMLARNPKTGLCVVSVEIVAGEGRKWVSVIEDGGDLISHIVEPLGVELAIKRAYPGVTGLFDSEETLS